MSDTPTTNTAVPAYRPAALRQIAIVPMPTASAASAASAIVPARRAEPVGQPRADDAHREDQHAVLEEDAANFGETEVVAAVELGEPDEAGERDLAREQHDAGRHRAPVQQRAPARAG